uniref:Uncharacterized protein n=1 Tax=Amphimedon queenslandica TaxID=400682 RepID=A0A1X7V4R0_AMPQE
MSLMKDGARISTGEERTVREGQDAYLKYAAHRDKAVPTIVLSADASLLYLVSDPTNAAVVWEMLSTQFQRKTNKLALRRRLHSLKLKGVFLNMSKC